LQISLIGMSGPGHCLERKNILFLNSDFLAIVTGTIIVTVCRLPDEPEDAKSAAQLLDACKGELLESARLHWLPSTLLTKKTLQNIFNRTKGLLSPMQLYTDQQTFNTFATQQLHIN
jgi:hypothetical protein